MFTEVRREHGYFGENQSEYVLGGVKLCKI